MTQASSAIERLLKLDLLEEKNNSIVPTGIALKTPTDIENSSLKIHTAQSLDMARESLFRDEVNIRDFSTITMAIDPDSLGDAKKMIREFRKKMMNKLERKNQKEVYKLSIQLFPLSHQEDK